MRKETIKKHFIRFRRWLRKTYSVFCSLHKHVTIGVIDSKIAKASIKKQSKLLEDTVYKLLSCSFDFNKEDFIEQELIIQTSNQENNNVEDKKQISFYLD